MNTKKKIVKVKTLKKYLSNYRKEKVRIGFTNGCFDILHYGHVNYLEKAKEKDQILIVGLNSDSSVQRIKGPARPINPEDNRAAVLAALACVDYVVLFDEDTPLKLIKEIQPDILFKGADWKGKEVVGSDIVKLHGGKVKLIKYVSGLSTSNMIDLIVKKNKS